jgi:hypothetical protein
MLLQAPESEDAFVRDVREITRICSEAAAATRLTKNNEKLAAQPSIAAKILAPSKCWHDGYSLYPFGPMPSFQIEVYLGVQRDGAKTVMFDLEGSHLWGEGTFCEELRDEALHDFSCTDYLIRRPEGDFVLLRSSWHWQHYRGWCEVKRVTDEEVAKWLVFGKFAVPDDLASLADAYRFPACTDHTCDDQPTIASTSANTVSQLANRSVEPSEDMRKSYRDSDNYERDRWLYEQKKAGKKNEDIRNELKRISYERGFDYFVSDNTLRSAIKSYAEFANVEVPLGKPGRRRTANGDSSSGTSSGD